MDILKKILLKHRVLYYNKNKLIHNNISKTDARNKIIGMFSKAIYKDKEIKLTRMEVSFHRGKKFYQGGVVQIKIKQYVLKNGKLSLQYSDGDNGSVWIDNKYLDKKKITTKKTILTILLELLKKVNKNKKLKIMGINKLDRIL